ncbi:hypothetical protein ACQEVC_35410 [Plantactinospora sp. CA-294935]
MTTTEDRAVAAGHGAATTDAVRSVDAARDVTLAPAQTHPRRLLSVNE